MGLIIEEKCNVVYLFGVHTCIQYIKETIYIVNQQKRNTDYILYLIMCQYRSMLI